MVFFENSPSRGGLRPSFSDEASGDGHIRSNGLRPPAECRLTRLSVLRRLAHIFDRRHPVSGYQHATIRLVCDQLQQSRFRGPSLQGPTFGIELRGRWS
jgi:hypothetical protein